MTLEAQKAFHIVILMSIDAGKIKLNNFQIAVNNLLLGIAVHLAQKAWHVLTQSCLLGRPPAVIQSYMECHSALIQS